MSESRAVLTVLPVPDCNASHNLIGGLLSCDLPVNHLGSMHYDAENGIEWRGSNDTPADDGPAGP